MAIRLTTLGRLNACTDDVELDWLPGQRLRAALLVYLAVERRVSRATLTALFWPESSERSARNGGRYAGLHPPRAGDGAGNGRCTVGHLLARLCPV